MEELEQVRQRISHHQLRQLRQQFSLFIPFCATSCNATFMSYRKIDTSCRDFLSRAAGFLSGYPTKNIPCGSQLLGKSKVFWIVSCVNSGQHAQTPPSSSACAASNNCNP